MSMSSSSRNFMWQSFDYPADMFLPEMKLRWDLRTGINRLFSSWSSRGDPSPGDSTWGMENINFPETMAWKDASKYFRSGPWNGLQFSGATLQSLNPIFWYNFVSNKEKIYYMYHVDNESMLVRTTLNQSNYFWELSTWSPKSQSWRHNLPYCQCMKGFLPRMC